MDAIEKFFLKPCAVNALPQELKDSGERPVLHLLRRDLQHLYLQEDVLQPNDQNEHKAPYLATMGILTGIDLMAKFYCGQGRKKASGRIFKKFLIDIGELSSSEADFAWKFRNALHHSYSLHISERLLGKIIFTTAISGHASWHTSDGQIDYINFWNLKALFLKLIVKYHERLRTSITLKHKFADEYEQAGRIFVQGQDKRG